MPVYNRVLNRLLRFLLATTIVATIPVSLAGAATPSEDVPVPGGRAALAAALGIHPVPDRARFVGELARLVHGLSDRNARDSEVLARELHLGAASAAEVDELVPVPLTAAVWSAAVFLRSVSPQDLVIAILGDRRAALLCYGLAALDDETLEYLAGHPSLITQIYTLGAESFAVFSSSLRIQGGRIVLPGSAEGDWSDDDVAVLWEAVVGERVTRPDRFMQLSSRSRGHLAGTTPLGTRPARQRSPSVCGSTIRGPSGSMRALAAASMAARRWRTRTRLFRGNLRSRRGADARRRRCRRHSGATDVTGVLVARG